MVRSVALFLLVFLLGAVAGGAVVYRCRGPARSAVEEAPWPVERRVGVLAARLGLRDEQRARVQELMAGYHRRFAARAHAVIGDDPELAAARTEMLAALRAILDDEQRRRLDELTADGGMPFGPGPMGPGPFGHGPPPGRGPPWLRTDPR